MPCIAKEIAYEFPLYCLMIDVRDDGLIDCSSCDAACCRLQVLLIDDADLAEGLLEWSEWGGQVMRRLEDGWCAGLDRSTLRCTIYAQRPQVCRDFEMGGYDCKTERHQHDDEGDIT